MLQAAISANLRQAPILSYFMSHRDVKQLQKQHTQVYEMIRLKSECIYSDEST